MASPATTLIRAGRPQGARPHERYLLEPEGWIRLAAALQAEPALALLALWAEPDLVHAAFLDEAEPSGTVLLASAPLRERHYAALSPARPGAALFERAVRDLWGAVADGAVDARPWLDHGRWPFEAPLSGAPVRRSAASARLDVFPGWTLPADAHLVPEGPVRGVVAEPSLMRFAVQGDAVLRAEARLGYAHKGVIGAMLGKSPRVAARFTARLSGDSTVAHSWAFAAAAEAAADASPPPRAALLRGLMCELERVANHLRDLARCCGAVGAMGPGDRFGSLRERLLRACAEAFGHRLMMDLVLPGGVASDVSPGGLSALVEAVSVVDAAMPGLAEETRAVRERLAGIGTLSEALVARFAAGGPVGRASGRAFDVRVALPHPPYDALPPTVLVLAGGDAAARLSLRLAEVTESLRLVPLLLDRLGAEPGEVAVPLPSRAGEGVGIVESFRGETLHWVALDQNGLLRACFPRDPSWPQWPLLQAAMASGDLADAAVCEASFRPSVSGVDL